MSLDMEDAKIPKSVWLLGSKEQTARVQRMRDSFENVSQAIV